MRCDEGVAPPVPLISGGALMAKRLRIVSPKRNERLQTGWRSFFPTTPAIPSCSALLAFDETVAGHPRVSLRHRGVTRYDRAMSRTLGIVTVGQAPRDDIAETFFRRPRADRHQGRPARRARRVERRGGRPAAAAKRRRHALHPPARRARRQAFEEGGDRALAGGAGQAARRRLRRLRSMPAPATSRRWPATRACCFPRAC